jgi:hypothetical protein
MLQEGTGLAEIIIPTDAWIAQFHATQKMLKYHQLSSAHLS